MIRSKRPSVITGNNAAPMSEQLQKDSQIREIQNKGSMKRTEMVGEKPGSSHGNYQKEI